MPISRHEKNSLNTSDRTTKMPTNFQTFASGGVVRHVPDVRRGHDARTCERPAILVIQPEAGVATGPLAETFERVHSLNQLLGTYLDSRPSANTDEGSNPSALTNLGTALWTETQPECMARSCDSGNPVCAKPEAGAIPACSIPERSYAEHV